MNSTTEKVPVLIVPGLYGSGPDHWQSVWERERPGMLRVVQDDWDRPDLGAWIDRLEQFVRRASGPPVLAAHSLGVALVAHWASRSSSRIRGALLVSPSDVDSPERMPVETRGFGPMPLAPLPFGSIVVASEDDPYVSFERARFFAGHWGSRLVGVGRCGHINADSCLGRWDRGYELLASLR